MNQFIIDQPTLDSYFIGIVLFDKNSATYKFALGKSIIELASNGTDFIPLKDLSIHFIKYTNEHVLNGNKQITSNSSKYFDALKKYNSNDCDIDELADCLEVIFAIGTKYGYGEDQVLGRSNEKKLNSCGFEDNLILRKTY